MNKQIVFIQSTEMESYNGSSQGLHPKLAGLGSRRTDLGRGGIIVDLVESIRDVHDKKYECRATCPGPSEYSPVCELSKVA